MVAAQDLSSVDLTDGDDVNLKQLANEVDLGEYSIPVTDTALRENDGKQGVNEEVVSQPVVADEEFNKLPEQVAGVAIELSGMNNNDIKILPERVEINRMVADETAGPSYAIVLAVLALISLVPVARRE